MPPVFQYGSNCDEARLNVPERLAGDTLYLGRAQTLDEYDIAFDVWSQTNACAASNLVLVAGSGRRSWGILYEIPADLIRGRRADGRRTLAQIEGSRYEERPIRVRNADGVGVTVTTFLVKADEQRSGLWTSFEYVQHIVRGLRTHEVSEEYVQRVIDIAIQTNNRAAQAVTEQIQLIEMELAISAHIAFIWLVCFDGLKRQVDALPSSALRSMPLESVEENEERR